MPPSTRTRDRRRATWIALGALLLFMGFVVHRSLHLGGIRCEVCIIYHGASQCRTVDGATREDALMAATTNACAYLSNGVTDGMACARTPPSRSECSALE